MKNVKLSGISAILLMTLIHQPAMAAKFKCWTNKEGVKECGTIVPPEYSQKRIEKRNASGRVVEVEKRAKTKEELEELARQAELKKQEDARIAEQKKKDSVLLKTFTRERDILMLRDSKINVIEGLITVTRGNNKALQKKLEKHQKKAANIERRGKTPPETLLGDIKSIERQMANNEATIKKKRQQQDELRKEYQGYLERFRHLKGIKPKPAEAKTATTK